MKVVRHHSQKCLLLAHRGYKLSKKRPFQSNAVERMPMVSRAYTSFLGKKPTTTQATKQSKVDDKQSPPNSFAQGLEIFFFFFF